MNRNDYGRHVSVWYGYVSESLQRVKGLDLNRATWEAFGGMDTVALTGYTDEALRASIRGRLLALEAWKARNGMDTPSLPALREGRGD